MLNYHLLLLENYKRQQNEVVLPFAGEKEAMVIARRMIKKILEKVCEICLVNSHRKATVPFSRRINGNHSRLICTKLYWGTVPVV